MVLWLVRWTFSPALGLYCYVVSLNMNLFSTLSLSPPRVYKWVLVTNKNSGCGGGWGYPVTAMYYYLIQRGRTVVILIAASCYRNMVKLWLFGLPVALPTNHWESFVRYCMSVHWV